MKSRKNLMLLLLVLGGLFIIGGTAYAFFNYSRIGSQSELVTGNIYLNYIDGAEEGITLTNAFPEKRKEARSRLDNTIEFIIEGINGSNNDIYYEIDLVDGDDVSGKTRLQPNELKFDLYEVVDGEEDKLLIGDLSFDSFNNQKIWVDTIGKREVDGDIKGTNYTYDINVSTCQDYFMNFFGSDNSDEQDEYESFCSGTGIIDGLNFEGALQMLSVDDLIDNNVISNYSTEEVGYKYSEPYDVGLCQETISAAISAMMGIDRDMSDEEDGYESFCQGTGTIMNITRDEVLKDQISDDDLADMAAALKNLAIKVGLENGFLVESDGNAIDTEYSKTYKLRMWIDENVMISDTNDAANYKTDEWEDMFGSVKVRVIGDFDRKDNSYAYITDSHYFNYVVDEIMNENIKTISFVKMDKTNLQERYNSSSSKVNLYNGIYVFIEDDELIVASDKIIVFPDDCNDLFGDFVDIEQINFDNVNTSLMTIMGGNAGTTKIRRNGSISHSGLGMFENCSSLTSLDLSKFDTSNVTDMAYLFSGCSSLTSLDLSSFDTSNVTDMSNMFDRCSSLTTIYVGNSWSTNSVDYGYDIFYENTSIIGGNGTTYDSSYTDVSYAHVDTAGNPGYLTLKTS